MKSNQFTFISNLFVILLFSSLFFSLSCDAAVNYQITIQNPATICLEWMADLSFIYSRTSHPIAFLLPLFFIFTNEEAKAVQPTEKPQSIAGAIVDRLKGIARWIGDKIKEILAPKSREVVWVILKAILKEIIRPILIISALGCWVFFYSLGIYFYVIYFFGSSNFWNMELTSLYILFGQAFGKAFKSVLLLELFRSSALFLLFLVAFLKKFG
jgi:hypothetical protein